MSLHDYSLFEECVANIFCLCGYSVERNVLTEKAKGDIDIVAEKEGVARFESGEAHVPADVMVGYADYFDVSLDYIFGRTDNPHGTHYEGKVKIEKAYPEMDKFIEMCFDPGSPMNEKLKETLKQMLKEGVE